MILIIFPRLHNIIFIHVLPLERSCNFYTIFVPVLLVVLLFSINKQYSFFVMQNNLYQQNSTASGKLSLVM